MELEKVKKLGLGNFTVFEMGFFLCIEGPVRVGSLGRGPFQNYRHPGSNSNVGSDPENAQTRIQVRNVAL